jgi:flagellar basal-body rod protein FlgF
MKEIYQILSGTMGQEERMAQIANNLANVSTVGFKKDGMAFLSFLKSSMKSAQSGQPVGKAANPADIAWPSTGVGYIDFKPGSFQKSGNALDVAITGDGFFRVEVAGEPNSFLTRAGNFKLNTKSELTTVSNRRVLDPNGNPIKLDLSLGSPEVGEDGTIKMKGQTVAQLGIYNVPNPQKLQKYGETLLKVPTDQTPHLVAKPRVRQGMTESSNVNVIEEMVNMIQVQRMDDSHQKLIQQENDLTTKRIDAANS